MDLILDKFDNLSRTRIQNLIRDEGGVEFAQNEIQRLSDEAREELNIFPDSRYKEALFSMLEFNLERMK